MLRPQPTAGLLCPGHCSVCQVPPRFPRNDSSVAHDWVPKKHVFLWELRQEGLGSRGSWHAGEAPAGGWQQWA